MQREEERKMEDLCATPQEGGDLAGSSEESMDVDDDKSGLKRDREELERDLESFKNSSIAAYLTRSQETSLCKGWRISRDWTSVFPGIRPRI